MARSVVPRFSLLLALSAAGCGIPHSAAPRGLEQAARAPSHGTAIVEVARPYALQSVVRRWLASDIYEYDVYLQVWNGSAFVDMSPALEVVLPQKVSPAPTKAVFSNLSQGQKYRPRLVIRGNAGGTAATTVLNSQSTLVPPTLDFSASQDVQDTQSETLVDQLDPMAFSGDAAISPANVPTGTTNLTAKLEDSTGALLSSVSYPVAQTAHFSPLKTGTTYQFVLQAYANSTLLSTSQIASCTWDPNALSLEQSTTVAVTF